MKRWIYLAAALLLAACSRETLPEANEIVETPQAKTYTVSLQATFNPETRLSFDLNNEGNPVWVQEDRVALFTHKGKKIEGEILPDDFSAESPTFTFTLEDDDYINEGATVYYPASIAVDETHIQLPSSYASVDAMNLCIPMKATVSGKKMAFQHLASIIYVAPFTTTPSYPSDDKRPQIVEFSVQGNNPITGTFAVEGLSLTPYVNNGTAITAPWELNKPYYFILPPGSYSFSVSIKAADGFTYYRKSRIKTPYEASRKNLLQMPEFDPQCKEYYLTGTATGWLDSKEGAKARMIQTDENTFVGALYNYDQSGHGSDYGFKILQGFNLGTSWNNVIGVYEHTPAAIYGNVGNIPADENYVCSVILTLEAKYWTAESRRVREASGDYDLQQIYLVGDFTNWADGQIAMNQTVKHNWTTTVTFATDVKNCGWKIYKGDWKDDQWYNGHINANKMYSSLSFDSTPGSPNGTINLPAGTYNVFFNDAISCIMFEKI